jgi:hypothetical protein
VTSLKSKKTGKLVKLIFFGTGFLWIAFGAFFFIDAKFFTSGSYRATGNVVELKKVRHYSTSTSKSISGYKTVYYPVIRYQTEDGKTIIFTSSSGNYPSPYKNGDRVEILYDPENPQKARIKSFSSMWLAPVLCFGIGGIMFFTGSVILMWGKFSGRKIEWFKRNGLPIMAEIEKISVNKKIKVNGKHPYKIHAKFLNPQTNEIQVFKSKNLWVDPGRQLTEKNMTSIEVWVDPQNYKKYLMNTGFLTSEEV